MKNSCLGANVSRKKLNEDCPMRPHKCGRVTAKMWLETWRDMRQLYGDLWDMWEEE